MPSIVQVGETIGFSFIQGVSVFVVYRGRKIVE